jgi:lactoylglutathione lyase
MNSRITQLSLYVQNVAETLAWYESTFGLARKMLSPNGNYGELDLGGFTLAFGFEEMERHVNQAVFTNNRRENEAAGMNLSVSTDDLEGQYQKALDNGATAIVPPHRKPWGIEIARVRDLNGVIVSIIKAQQ